MPRPPYVAVRQGLSAALPGTEAALGARPVKKTARSLSLILSSLAAPTLAFAAPSDGSCVEASSSPIAAVSAAVSGAAALTSAPSPARFATAWTSEFAAAVRGAAGTDGRLSLKEAERLAQSSMFGDNAVNWLIAKDQKSVDVEKLLKGGWAYAFATGKKAAGDDGRISLADAAAKLPADLRADYLYLRGKEGVPPANGLSAEAVLASLANTTEGLYLMSESDAWAVPVSAASNATGSITADEVKAVFGAQHDAMTIGTTGVWRFPDAEYKPIAERYPEVRDAKEWLDRRATTFDPADPASVELAQKWAATGDVLEGLSDLTVVRFNESPDPDVAITSSIYVVGRSADGKLVGLLTAAVET